jgi:hypothetical protein
VISGKRVAKAVFGRFLPASAFLYGVGLVPVILSGVVGISPLAPFIASAQVLSASVGFGLTLFAMRRKLSSDAPVDSRPSIVAGAVSPVAIMLGLMLAQSPHTIPGMIALSAATGCALALGMFFPWLSNARAYGATASPMIESADDKYLMPPSPFIGTSRTYSRSFERTGRPESEE